MNRLSRGVLTLALGHPRYRRMAVALAQSIRLRDPSCHLSVVTDRADSVIHKSYDQVIAMNPSFGSNGFVQKLHLDHYSPYECTLFIDADCLAFQSIEGVWRHFEKESSFGVTGYSYLNCSGTHYAVPDLARAMDRLHLTRFPEFNSGMLCFDRSEAAMRVFQTARRLSRDSLHELCHANAMNDEPFFSAAIELCGIDMLPWSDIIMTVMGRVHGLETINVLTGQSAFEKNDTLVHPSIIHFHQAAQRCYIYQREILRLRLHNRGLPSQLAPSLARGAVAAHKSARAIHKLWRSVAQSKLPGKGAS